MIKRMKYACEFSHNGKNWIREKEVSLSKAWDWLTKEGRTFKNLNKNGKIRIVNLITNGVVGDK